METTKFKKEPWNIEAFNYAHASGLVVLTEGGIHICYLNETFMNGFGETRKTNQPVKEYAEFISEAGNIHFETGLTPRQLLEQRDEAIRLIEKINTDLTEALNHPHAAEECEEVAASLTDDIEEYIQKTTKAGC